MFNKVFFVELVRQHLPFFCFNLFSKVSTLCGSKKRIVRVKHLEVNNSLHLFDECYDTLSFWKTQFWLIALFKASNQRSSNQSLVPVKRRHIRMQNTVHIKRNNQYIVGCTFYLFCLLRTWWLKNCPLWQIFYFGIVTRNLWSQLINWSYLFRFLNIFGNCEVTRPSLFSSLRVTFKHFENPPTTLNIRYRFTKFT